MSNKFRKSHNKKTYNPITSGRFSQNLPIFSLYYYRDGFDGWYNKIPLYDGHGYLVFCEICKGNYNHLHTLRLYLPPPSFSTITDMDEFLNELKDKFYVNKIASVFNTKIDEQGTIVLLLLILI